MRKYMKEKQMKISYIIYIAAFLLISLVPLVTFSDRQAAIGNETKADKPKLSDGLMFTQNADDYFAQNFGLRNRLVYVGNAIKQTVFKTSGQAEVIIGEDGWLFYESALADYIGTNDMTQLELEKAAVILKMMQSYVEYKGGQFVFFSAPNKMSVYGEYMPYYYLESGSPGNFEGLYTELAGLVVNTVQLKNELALEKLGGIQLYHKLDSHWNNYGAAVAYEAVAKALTEAYGEEYAGYTRYSELPYSIVNNFTGDLQSMLLPGSAVRDEQVEFDVKENFEYTGRFRGVDDLLITTQNMDAAVDKSVTLFRDSFGNALYWFFANDYAAMSARREVPYNLYRAADESELVAVELVERNLKNLLQYTPVIPSWNLGEGFLKEKGISLLDSRTEEEEICEAVVAVTTTADGLIQISGSCKAADGAANMYLAGLTVSGNGTGDSGDEQWLVYRLIPCEGEEDFELYLEPGNDALPLTLSERGQVFLIVEKQGVYEKITINVTLQD